MFEHMHHQNGCHQTQKVSNERGIKVQLTLSLQTMIESQEQRNKNARNHNVAKAEHSKVGRIESVGQQILGEHQFDGRIEILGHRHHYVRSEHPENVVHKETAQQNHSGHDVVQMQQFHTVNGKRNAKQIVGNPMFLQQIPNTNACGQNQTENIVGGKFVIDEILFLFPFALCEQNVKRNVWKSGRNQRTDHRTDEMRQRKDAEHEKVAGQQHVNVILGENLEGHVETEQGHRSNNWKLHGIFGRHHVWFIAGRLQMIVGFVLAQIL